MHPPPEEPNVRLSHWQVALERWIQWIQQNGGLFYSSQHSNVTKSLQITAPHWRSFFIIRISKSMLTAVGLESAQIIPVDPTSNNLWLSLVRTSKKWMFVKSKGSQIYGTILFFPHFLTSCPFLKRQHPTCPASKSKTCRKKRAASGPGLGTRQTITDLSR